MPSHAAGGIGPATVAVLTHDDPESLRLTQGVGCCTERLTAEAEAKAAAAAELLAEKGRCRPSCRTLGA